ncbi:MAG: MBL fold metallo-hydrolase [Treponema sp.]|jgi:phosphoribosyl 1,2-cyclic phosphate phosphodiesterase|nr:MBL fold metallo-hydrolase [Treponema sp.]
MKLIVLGSGTSNGIPVIGCGCPVCASEDPKDKRMRSSLLIEGDAGERVVIDTGPEFRLQALRAKISSLDAVFLTHAHADHVHGLDDVRPLSWDRELPVYGNAKTLSELTERFAYVFQDTQRGGGKPRLKLNVADGPVRIGDLLLTPVPVQHGSLGILGWKISEAGKRPFAAYLTDTSLIPESSAELIRGPALLIVGGLRERPHETHFNFEQALSAGAALGAERVCLTHICHGHSHREIGEYCRRFREARGLGERVMEPAYDQMEIVL